MLNNVEECSRALDDVPRDPLATEWDNQWAETIANQHATTGTYLPIHDVQIEYAPAPNPEPFESFWPQSSAPTEELLVADVSAATPQEEFAMTVLQGLVNRRQPRLYLLHTRYERLDRQWLDELRTEGCSALEVSVEQV